ncbi:MAG: NADH-quinone oxidoreductase subunit I [Streptosporangiaceae bacterium]|nr:NADH-quinone oxidoreductase subunit I [Streptosporangiaceae bacterium]
MTAVTAEDRTARTDPRTPGLPRLLPRTPEDLRAHLARHGRLPYRGHPGLLIGDVKAAGLTGRGGAAFPTYRKLAVVAQARGRPVAIANGAESEPASHKDALLLRTAPHLVLDGLQLAAEAVGAAEARLYLHRGASHEVLRALAERAAAGTDRLEVTVAEAPPRFLAGQETALVSRIDGGPALPRFGLPRVSERGVGGAPTLVQNVETLAHIALIARYGPRWFRAAGTAAEPGTMLATVYRPDGQCTVFEAAIGTPLRDMLPDLAGTQALLAGGFHGTWLAAPRAAQLTLDNETLRRHGASLGAGVLAALPPDRCGLGEAARVARYLAAESAGQCGPCFNGLPRIAAAMAELAGPKPRSRTRQDAERWAALVTGRGACHHPDGTVQFVRSALTVFAPELDAHQRGRCSASNRRPFLPLPDGMPATEEDWV